MLVSIDSSKGLAMVMALLFAAIAWNLGTWLMAIPASSSHTLIGAILGVGMANSVLNGKGLGSGVNWSKALEVGLSLLISPLIGFAAGGRPAPLDQEDGEGSRTVSAAQGRRAAARLDSGHAARDLHWGPSAWPTARTDGQKGIGLIMLLS